VSSGRLQELQDAAVVYENGRRGDSAATAGVTCSLLLIYFSYVDWRSPGPAVETITGAIAALGFWGLRRGPVTKNRLHTISATAFAVAGVLSVFWAYLLLEQIAPRDWWLPALRDVGMFAGLGGYAYWAALRMKTGLQVGREEYQLVRAEAERAELQREVDADAVTRSFLRGTKMWFVRPIDQFACVIRIDLYQGKARFEKLAVVAVNEHAIKEKLIELGGADAVGPIREKLGWPTSAA